TQTVRNRFRSYESPLQHKSRGHRRYSKFFAAGRRRKDIDCQSYAATCACRKLTTACRDRGDSRARNKRRALATRQRTRDSRFGTDESIGGTTKASKRRETKKLRHK